MFLPRLLDGELPYRARKSEADPEEERRLLYVGITRAREHLILSWPREPRSAPSPFLREIGVVKAEAAGHSAAKARRHADARHGRRRRRSVVRSPEGVASPACLDRRRSRLRDLPRLDARRDRGARTERLGRPRGGAGHRAGKPSIAMPTRSLPSSRPTSRYQTSRAVRNAAARRGTAIDSNRSPASGAARRVEASTGSRPVVQRHLAAHVDYVAPQAPDGRGQRPLRRAERCARGRGEQRGDAERRRLREVRREHREGPPRQREPQVRMEGAAEQLEVVARPPGTPRRR